MRSSAAPAKKTTDLLLQFSLYFHCVISFLFNFIIIQCPPFVANKGVNFSSTLTCTCCVNWTCDWYHAGHGVVDGGGDDVHPGSGGQHVSACG